MKIIKVLGTGCSKCKVMYETTLKAVEQSGIAAQVIKVEDIMEIMKYNVLSTPVLVVDEVIKAKGIVPSLQDTIQLITEVTEAQTPCCAPKQNTLSEPFFGMNPQSSSEKCCS